MATHRILEDRFEGGLPHVSPSQPDTPSRLHTHQADPSHAPAETERLRDVAARRARGAWRCRVALGV